MDKSTPALFGIIDSVKNFADENMTAAFILYGCGCLPLIVTFTHYFGGATGGTIAGILVVLGVLFFESVKRHAETKSIKKEIYDLTLSQHKLSDEMIEVLEDVKRIKKKIASPSVATPPKDAMGDFLSTKSKATATAQNWAKNIQRSKRAVANEQDMSLLRARPVSFEEQDTNNREPIKSIPPMTASTETSFSPLVVSELLHHAVQNDRVEIFAQPIVRLPSRKLAYLEIFGRIRARAGVYLTAETYRKMAEDETLIHELDHSLLTHICGRLQADMRRKSSLAYFLNISAKTLTNIQFMQDLVRFLKSNRPLAPLLIFEIQQREFDQLSDRLRHIIRGLADIGCQFSIDNIQHPNIKPQELASYGIRFLKLDAARLVHLTEQQGGEAMVKRLKSSLDYVGIQMIVEKVETERDLKELLDYNIDFGEGFLFGKPDLELAYRQKTVS
jgi:cyclic-di-GMP phosphodiesterase, flagellum assembly factor TipF